MNPYLRLRDGERRRRGGEGERRLRPGEGDRLFLETQTQKDVLNLTGTVAEQRGKSSK